MMGNIPLPTYAKVFLLLSILTGISSAIFFTLLVEPHPVPQVEDEYWGPKSDQFLPEDTNIYPFKIDIKFDIISDLKERLGREVNLSESRLPPPLEGVGFEYGFNSKFLQTVGKYWLKEYKWEDRQRNLKKYPHFKTKIGGLNIHFQHVKQKSLSNKEVMPLLLIHGWPGSFVEFQKIIPLLVDSQSTKYSYELVIPSLPGFGFSDAAARPGMSCTEMANIFKRLMTRLGYNRFGVVGGDWGSQVTTDLAILYPYNVIAAQSNLCFSTTVITGIKYLLATQLPSIFRTDRDRGQPKILPASELLSYFVRETGYFHLQATKPDTIGVGLTQSPLGLAAYILEKFSVCINRQFISREDGGLLTKFTMDELLDNVMVYWVTGSITAAGRLYKEQMNPYKKHQLDRVPVRVPFSCQYMPEEIFVLPEYSLQDKYVNIQNYTVESRGGHFAAFEEPQLVADNLISHFDRF